MAEPKRIAWILGAGFSRSLGGPLLADMLSPRLLAAGLAMCPSIRDEVSPAYELFWRHHKEESFQRHHAKVEERTLNATLWEHAEEYLDFVDAACAAERGAAAALLDSIVTRAIDRLKVRAAKAVALDCLFTERTSAELEQWQPYIHWAKNLGVHDSIITFNYDVVLEKTFSAVSKEFSAENSGKVFEEPYIVLPHLPPEEYDPSYRRTRRPKVFKLHGSVNWVLGNGETVAAEDPLGILIKRGHGPLIATPGGAKARFVNGLFRPLWDQALDAIKSANVVVFLGYRFPPSDAQSRTRVLSALRDNANSTHGLKIYTVLGPRLHDDDTVRLLQMLRLAVKSGDRYDIDDETIGRDYDQPWFRVIPQPLYVQDFLTVIDRNELFRDLDMYKPVPRDTAKSS
jgi:hypothetical protein